MADVPNGPNGNGPTSPEFSSIDQRITIAARTLVENAASAAVGKQFIIPFVTEATFLQRFGEIQDTNLLVVEINLYNDSFDDEVDDETQPNSFSTTLYNQFNSTDIAQVDKQTITSGLFSNGSATLTSLFTASLQGATTASYVEVFNANPASDTTAKVQFALGYAHVGGSGSIGNTTKTTAGNRETAALYRQFRNVILAPNEQRFKFTSSPSSSGHEDFYFLAFNRAQMREKVDPGNWEIRLNSPTHGAIRLIDDSGATTNPDVNVSGRVFNIVSGSISTGTAVVKTAAASETSTGAPGLFYPDLGILIFNPTWLSQATTVGSQLTPPRSANTFDDQANKFFQVFATGSGGLTPYVQARREEQISSVSYFARARNDQFNFSSNPTYKTGSSVTDSDGNITTTNGLFKVPSFKGDPRAYITQVGLYDGDGGELVAVAKLSQPILKSFSREAVVKVKLDY